MRHSSWTWLTPIAVVIPIGLAHCSGSDSGTKIGPDGGPILDATAGGDDAPVADDAAHAGDDAGTPGPRPDAEAAIATDGGPVEAGGPPPIPVPEGGAPSDPGFVACGSTPCSVASAYCCARTGDAGPIESCLPPNAGCGGAKLGCNEASDCSGGVCCQQILGLGVQGAMTCAPTQACAGGTFQACRTDAECAPEQDGGAFKKCIVQTCTNPTTHVPMKVEACAAHTGPGGLLPGPLAGCVAD